MRRLWLGVLVVAACSTPTNTTTTIPVTAVPTTGPTVAAPPASEVFAPETIGAFPVVVMFHGGGWFGGSPISTAALAEYLSEQGVVVFNSTYRTGNGGGYPESFDDVACAIADARAQAPAYTSTPEALTVVGHSAGAHLGSVVSLSDDVFGAGCDDTAQVARFIGLSGVYDPTLYSQLLATFFHTRYENDPAPWEAGNPYSYLDAASDLEVLLLHGDNDQLVPPSSSELFAAALEDAGHDVTLELLAGGDHQSTRQPDPAGALILDWLLPEN